MISSVPVDVLEAIVQLLGLDGVTSIHDFTFAGGGCINSGGKLKTPKGNFFVKWNDKTRYPDMFRTESAGLDLLRRKKAIRIPEVIGVDETEKHQFLILEFIEQGRPSKKYWEYLGVQLAGLHNVVGTRFGLDHDNYIGSLKQHNRLDSSWVNFFIEQRLVIQQKLAVDGGYVNYNWAKKFEILYKRLPSLLPEESPALLHGDLWSGNVITDEMGEPCLIDPAVYFGHREVDLAMTRLFGGFDESFYSAYEDTFPLQAGFENRVQIYNLYPLLVHVNLFGGSYVRSVDCILNAFA